MLNFTGKTYTSYRSSDVDTQIIEIDLNKPYTIVSGTRGAGKSTYIKAMKKFNLEMQYIEVQDAKIIDRYVLKNADNVINITCHNKGCF